jgi:hypothetical protein
LKRGGWPATPLYAHNWNKVTTVFSSAPYELAVISRSDALQRASTSPTRGFERNLDFLVRAIVADGAQPILFGFVEARETLLSRNRSDLAGLEHAWKIGLERNLAVMRRIADAGQLTYLDPNDFHTKDEWFLDNCHLNEEGERAKAAFVAGHLKKVTVLELDK